jgi:hypothetical protein
VLGFGAGDQDVAGDFEFEAPEFLFAGKVLGRFAGSAAHNQREVTVCVCGGDGLFGMRVEPGAVATEDMEEQKFRREREGGDVRFAQLGETLLEHGANVDHFFTLAK